MRADLHNHSCLSPCASLEMSPRRLVIEASRKGITILALTDHNSTKNCPAFEKLCYEAKIVPIFGLEACTREEVHILCLFTDLDAAMNFGDHCYRLLPPIPHNPEQLGDQVVVNEDEEILEEVGYYLGSALDLGVDEIGPLVESAGGMVIPAHIDRPAFSMISQLGFVVDGPWAALECIRIPPAYPTGSYPLITGSDAHYVEHIGRRSFELAVRTQEEKTPDKPDERLAWLKACLGSHK
ncbi:PHP domain-containing protein [Treponema sp. J25]|uniref:PHP domain-containing protein n=1 Tax=Treponema sp. J25 TaxID=2094121 RepID=UPI001053FE98|nr:PHP domain-containing protein [Treponema sp. J25]TCW61703.1 histidinol-phosphatase [Treponema sp. J25]